MIQSREEAAIQAISEDLNRFSAMRRLAIAQFLEAISSTSSRARLHELQVEFSIHSARDYAQRALHFHGILQTLLGKSEPIGDPTDED